MKRNYIMMVAIGLSLGFSAHSAEKYSSSKTYGRAGITVTYQGKDYKSKYWTKGDIPSDLAAWELVGGKADGSSWDRKFAYTKGGMKVSYQGKMYESNWWTKGDVPSNLGPWKLVSGSVVAAPTPTPTPGPGVVPGPSEPPVAANGAEAWNKNKSYSGKGVKVTYSGNTYEHIAWWSQGNDPTVFSQIWKKIGSSGVPGGDEVGTIPDAPDVPDAPDAPDVANVPSTDDGSGLPSTGDADSIFADIPKPTGVYKKGVFLGRDTVSTVMSGKAKRPALAKAYKNTSGMIVGGYYPTWGVYGRSFGPESAPVGMYDRVYVSFLGICGNNPAAHEGGSALKKACAGEQNSVTQNFKKESRREGGEVYFDDLWAYEGASAHNASNLNKMPLYSGTGNYRGVIGGLRMAKKANPNVKIIWSVGGWSYSRPFFSMVKSSSSRKKFIDSLMEIAKSQHLKGLMDGFDIDWEFPGGHGADAGVGDKDNDGRYYVALLSELRQEMDKIDPKWILSIATGVGPTKLAVVGKHWKDIAKYSEINMMSYDFSGSWSSKVYHQTNPYKAKYSEQPRLSIEEAVVSLIETYKVPPSRLHVGVAYYGRGFAGVSNTSNERVLGNSVSGKMTSGTHQAGSYSFFDLYENYLGSRGRGINGWRVYFDNTAKAPLLINDRAKEVITYDNAASIKEKSKIALRYKLGGIFAWDMSDDNGLLLNAIHEGLNHPKL